MSTFVAGGCSLSKMKTHKHFRYLLALIFVLFIFSCISLLLLKSPAETALFFNRPPLYSTDEGNNSYVYSPPLQFSPLRVVASLSSFPGRVEKVYETIRSLHTQSYHLDQVYLNLPKNVIRLNISEESYGSSVQHLQSLFPTFLTIRFCDDYGPQTKLLPTLLTETNPDTVIIVVDDDVIYNYRMVKALVDRVEWHQKSTVPLPPFAFAFACEVWNFDSQSSRGVSTEGPCMGWLAAYAGVAFRRGFFDMDVFDIASSHPGCKLHDDVYFSGYLLSRGIRPFLISPWWFSSSVLYHLPYSSLTIHKVQGGVDLFQNPCIRHYNYLLWQ